MSAGVLFEHETFLALDEEDVRRSVSITSLALSPFEVVTATSQSVSRGFHLHCIKLRHFKSRKEQAETKIIPLLTRGPEQWISDLAKNIFLLKTPSE